MIHGYDPSETTPADRLRHFRGLGDITPWGAPAGPPSLAKTALAATAVCRAGFERLCADLNDVFFWTRACSVKEVLGFKDPVDDLVRSADAAYVHAFAAYARNLLLAEQSKTFDPAAPYVSTERRCESAVATRNSLEVEEAAVFASSGVRVETGTMFADLAGRDVVGVPGGCTDHSALSRALPCDVFAEENLVRGLRRSASDGQVDVRSTVLALKAFDVAALRPVRESFAT